MAPVGGKVEVYGFWTLVVGTAVLSWRHNTSAALEQPIVFSLLTLLWVGLALAGYDAVRSRKNEGSISLPRTGVLESLRSARTRWLSPSNIIGRPRPPSQFVLLLGCILLRTVCFAQMIHRAQCSMSGVSVTALPLLLGLLDIARLPGRCEYLPTKKEEGEDDGTAPRSRREKVIHLVVALAWALLAARALALAEFDSGAVCPAVGFWSHVPSSQLATLLLDVLIISKTSRLVVLPEGELRKGESWSKPIAALCLTAAALLVLVSALAAVYLPYLGTFAWIYTNSCHLLLRDLVLDSFVAAGVLLSALSLLASVQPTTLAALGGGLSVYFYILRHLLVDDPIHIPGSATSQFMPFAIVSLVTVLFLIDLRNPHPHPASENPLLAASSSSSGAEKKLKVIYFALLAFLAGVYFFSSSRLSSSLPAVIASSAAASNSWINSANRSKTLTEAAFTYRKRYGIPPPPNFDKWYEFATNHSSHVIDSFDQINDDLAPFWGLRPAMLREESRHMLQQRNLGIGGIRIRNRKIELSKLTPGTHFWMMEGLQSMIEPFAEYLPDMDLAFNLDDECRVAVPFGDMSTLHANGRTSWQKLSDSEYLGNFTKSIIPSWPSQKAKSKQRPLPRSPYFLHYPHPPIYDALVAPACAPESAARTQRWWSPATSHPSARGGVATDLAGVSDLCARPDLAHQHGFLLDPGSFHPTRHALPIFSQSKASGCADILVPSPWTFVGKVDIDRARDMPWDDKSDVVYWRGASTDGLSRSSDSWTGFLRSRFVALAGRAAAAAGGGPGYSGGGGDDDDDGDMDVDVSFVGNFTKCEGRQCEAQAASFPARAEVVDFQTHWSRRHLVDLDGAGFSGRFVPFLRSNSVVYRATLFRTWYTERVHAWRHFVPLDVGLARAWEVVRFVRRGGGGGHDARIAREGKDWAERALRREDMQIYMFRLLLEWGRLIDDNRERVGFEVSAG